MSDSTEDGFSLVELSIVLVIIGVIAGSTVMPLVSSLRQSHYQQTNAQLQSIREALFGYLASTGKLPCPVDHELPQALAFSDITPCAQSSGGVPATQLGLLGERADNGALLDRWGSPYQYVVSMADSDEAGVQGVADWVNVGEPALVGASQLLADLQLCRKAVSNQCPQSDLIADQIVWVVYSLGERDGTDGIQIENQDNDTVYSVSGYSSNEEQPFDDQIIWASRSELIYWLLKANWLP